MSPSYISKGSKLYSAQLQGPSKSKRGKFRLIFSADKYICQVAGPPKIRGLWLWGKAWEIVLAKWQSWRRPNHSVLLPLLWIHRLLLLESKAATGVPWKLTRQEAMMLGSLLGEGFISALGMQTSWCKRKPTPSNWYTAVTSCWEIWRTGWDGILHSIYCKQDVRDWKGVGEGSTRLKIMY